MLKTPGFLLDFRVITLGGEASCFDFFALPPTFSSVLPLVATLAAPLPLLLLSIPCCKNQELEFNRFHLLTSLSIVDDREATFPLASKPYRPDIQLMSIAVGRHEFCSWPVVTKRTGIRQAPHAKRRRLRWPPGSHADAGITQSSLMKK